MKAAVRYRYGSPDVVRIEEIARPTPIDDQVLVRVRAASVNRADLDYLSPRPAFIRAFVGLRAPRNPRIGNDAAGVVEAVGPATTRFRPGDAVFGDLFSFGQGAFADYVCTPERAFEPIPAGMSFADAATLPHSGILAIQGLRLPDGRTPKPGDRVLVDGASGSVGPFAVQVAKALGAEVTAVANSTKLDFVRSVGADRVIDYVQVDFTKTGERYDWILAVDSHHSLLSIRRALRPNGVYSTLGGTTLPALAALVAGPVISRATGRRLGLMLWWKPFHAPDVATLRELFAAGRLRPAIDRRFPLEQVVDALRWVSDGHARGKVVIEM